MKNLFDIFKKNPKESVDEYKLRCYKEKLHSNITWNLLASIMNKELGFNYSESYYRKEAKLINNNFQYYNKEEIEEFLLSIKKEKVKLNEERIQNNSYIRRLAREDTIKEIAYNFALTMNKDKILSSCDLRKSKTNLDRLGILLISDWHYGMEFSNFLNTYSPEICKDRVQQLLQEVISIGNENNIRDLYIVNLSDLIAGRIHLTTRLESRCDVISQVMEVSEILAEFINLLSHHFNIHYIDVLDNHSRLEPVKSDSLELETLVRIIPWYLKQRLYNRNNIEFIDNKFSDDIGCFNVYDFNVVAVHGHKDKPGKIINNLSSMTRQKNDLILSAHYHHCFLEEKNSCIHISNGSLMGTDNYAVDLREDSHPSQTLIISTPTNVVRSIYKIDLK